tara:strand:+ start:94 stop:552 length:459 start_codon:yes stop_codon:yes gene_type:complete
MTPEWRCRSRSCGYEWDATIQPEELMEALRLEVARKDRQLRAAEERSRNDQVRSRNDQMALEALREEERRRKDQMELEELREEVDIRESVLNSLGRERDRKEKNLKRGTAFACNAFFIGLIGAALLGLYGSGIILGIIAFSFGAYVLGDHWG